MRIVFIICSLCILGSCGIGFAIGEPPVPTFQDPRTKSLSCKSSLNRLQIEYDHYRGSQAKVAQDVMDEISQLKTENSELKERLAKAQLDLWAYELKNVGLQAKMYLLNEKVDRLREERINSTEHQIEIDSFKPNTTHVIVDADADSSEENPTNPSIPTTPNCENCLKSCTNEKFAILSNYLHIANLALQKCNATNHLQSQPQPVSLVSTPVHFTTQITGSYEMMKCQRDTAKDVSSRLVSDNSTIVAKIQNTETVTSEKIIKEAVRYKCFPRICVEVLYSGRTTSGIYKIYPEGNNIFAEVYCDMTTDGGGWTTILSRGENGSEREDFNRTWTEYETGFGNTRGDYFLGLKTIHAIAPDYEHNHRLRIDLSDWLGDTAYVYYSSFRVEESPKYEVVVFSYSGNAGDSFSYHQRSSFSTFDRDNDLSDSRNCASLYGGGWWYKDCFEANLNGKYEANNGRRFHGIEWNAWKGASPLKTARMMIRDNDVDVGIIQKQRALFSHLFVPVQK